MSRGGEGTRRRGWATAADVGLTIAAVLGALCIVLAIAAAVFDVRIVLFRTGSMSPAIPAGSAALVHGIPASDVAIGDVVMVDRAGDLPITHRVVAVDAVPGSDDLRSITMRGDANAVDDPAPYQVSHVRRVLMSVPGIAPVLAAVGTPWVIGGLTIAAATLIAVVFWPRRPRREAASTDLETDDEQTSPPGEGASGAGVGTAVRVRRRT